MAITKTPLYPDHSSLITYIQHPQPNNNFVPQPSFNTNYLQHPMQNPKDISNPTTTLDMALELMAKAFQLNNTTPTNNNQRSSSNPCYSEVAQSGMKRDQDRQMLMVDDNVRNQFRQNAVQNVGHLHGNGNVVSARAEGNSNRINGNPIRCYNYQGEGHYASNCTQASTAGTQTYSAPVYDSDGLAKNDSNVISEVSSVEQGRGTVEQHPVTVEETQADESLTKHKALELEIERLLRAVVSQDIMSIVQRDKKGKSKDTPCVSNTIDPLSQKLENENVELEFQVLNYAKENAHLKTTYKNLFDSISVTRTQTKTIIDYLQNKLHKTIYENAKLRAQIFDKVSEQKDATKGTSVNTQFCKQSLLGKPPSSSGSKLYVVTPFPKSKGLPKIDETHALSKPVTSNSVPTPQDSKVAKNDNVIAPGMFRINPFKASR
ncbi:hypothetical protein Tco_0666611 [Tanacetum coccineum]